MNTHDIELPQLPEPAWVDGEPYWYDRHMEAYAREAIEADRKQRSFTKPSTNQDWLSLDPAVAFHLIERHAENWNDAGAMMQAYLDAHIEADRKRRMPPSEPFAIVIDRIYDGEGPSLAYWNGENYQFSDGDCFNREGDTLDGYTAEFLTDYQLEQRLFSDRKRRGEPVGWLYEDELPDNYPYEAMFPYSKVDGVRMFPVYAPQPAEPVVVGHGETRANIGLEVETGSDLGGVVDHGEVEQVKVPSDAREALWEAYETLRELEKEIVLDVNQISGAAAASFAANRVRTLLARYSTTTDEATKQQKEIEESMRRGARLTDHRFKL